MKTFSQFIQEARRIQYYRVYSGRSPEDAENIKKTGQFRSPISGGASGPGIYGSTNKNVARTYARSGGSSPESGDQNVVQMRVPKSDVKITDSGYEGRLQSFNLFRDDPETRVVRIPNTAQPEELKTPKKYLTGIGKRDSSGDHVVLNPDYASSKLISKSQPTMSAKGKKRRSKTQPKKRK